MRRHTIEEWAINPRTVGHDIVMGGIHIDWLIEREPDIARHDCLVDRRVELADTGLRQPGDELLQPPYTSRRGGRTSRSIAVPEAKIFNGRLTIASRTVELEPRLTIVIFILLPLLLRECVTEAREAKSDGLPIARHDRSHIFQPCQKKSHTS